MNATKPVDNLAGRFAEGINSGIRHRADQVAACLAGRASPGVTRGTRAIRTGAVLYVHRRNRPLSSSAIHQQRGGQRGGVVRGRTGRRVRRCQQPHQTPAP